MHRLISKKFSSCVIFILSIFLSGCSAIGSAGNNAAVQITSNPQSSVFINDKHVGKTPFFSDQLEAGTYTIKLSASEAVYVDRVELKSGALTVINRDLNNNLFAQSGEILWLTEGSGNEVFIGTSPTNSEITVDGQLKGKSPLIISNLETGDHKVKISSPNFIEREFTIKNSSKYKLVASVTLASKAAKNPDTNVETLTTNRSVEILKTPQDFLRVRKEPDLSAQEIGQVKTGNTYEIIQETEEWIKISFDGKLGWISSQYTKII